MMTIYWLSMFGALVGIGVFVLSILGSYLLYKNGNILDRLVIEKRGMLAGFRWEYLLIGIACLIIVATI